MQTVKKSGIEQHYHFQLKIMCSKKQSILLTFTDIWPVLIKRIDLPFEQHPSRLERIGERNILANQRIIALI